jgi:hypothetical protein
MPMPCDPLLGDPDAVYHRAVDVEAAPAVLYRWLCQLRAAPYSYDWIDNLGRRSPQQLTPGLEQLQQGQRVMTIFELACFEPDRHLTVVLRRARRSFGDISCTYMVLPRGEGRSRLLVRMRVRHPGGRVRRALQSIALPWGDLVMMRRQLLNLKQLAERKAV